MNQPTRQPASPIDMLAPGDVCRRLALSDAALVDLINDGTLAAYNLGGRLRFRAQDVRRIEAGLVAV